MNWIDIKDRIPKLEKGQSENVLGFSDENKIFHMGYFEMEMNGDVFFHEDSGGFVITITHWAKLTPPKPKHLKCPY